MKILSIGKVAASASLLMFLCMPVSAYEIKHGYSVDNGMEYYGTCSDGGDLRIIEQQDGTTHYEGPKGKGKVKGGMDKAARKACGESGNNKK